MWPVFGRAAARGMRKRQELHECQRVQPAWQFVSYNWSHWGDHIPYVDVVKNIGAQGLWNTRIIRRIISDTGGKWARGLDREEERVGTSKRQRDTLTRAGDGRGMHGGWN